MYICMMRKLQCRYHQLQLSVSRIAIMQGDRGSRGTLCNWMTSMQVKKSRAEYAVTSFIGIYVSWAHK